MDEDCEDCGADLNDGGYGYGPDGELLCPACAAEYDELGETVLMYDDRQDEGSHDHDDGSW